MMHSDKVFVKLNRDISTYVLMLNIESYKLIAYVFYLYIYLIYCKKGELRFAHLHISLIQYSEDTDSNEKHLIKVTVCSMHINTYFSAFRKTLDGLFMVCLAIIQDFIYSSRQSLCAQKILRQTFYNFIISHCR